MVCEAEMRTQVLDILVGGKRQGAALTLAGTSASAESLVDDDAVGSGGGDEGCAVAEACRRAAGAEEEDREAVAQRADEKGDVSHEPGKLQGLGQCQ